MKKHIIQIVIDAYCFHNLELRIGKKNVTPFLNELSNKSLCAVHMYSQAPYTEASMVTLLSGENVLENGGYLFANQGCKTSIFKTYKKNGYTCFFSYSPYIYSKSYLKNVENYYYTRLFSIEPLLLYRLTYYRELLVSAVGQKKEMRICVLLLEEAFSTWREQVNAILVGKKEAKLLVVSYQSLQVVREVKYMLYLEYRLFVKDKIAYMERLFNEWREHPLFEINERYNRRKELPLKEYLQSKYKKQLNLYQKKYSKIVWIQQIDWNYVIGTAFRNKHGYKDFKGLIHNYIRHYGNKELSQYMDKIDKDAKTELSMPSLLHAFYKDILKSDTMEKPSFSYIHVQDFHLPSVFHTVDSTNKEQIDKEFEESFILLDELDTKHRGNLIASLSAAYCDNKLKDFYNQLTTNLKHDFIFVVTADHGFPSYEFPPRPMVYNQTYSEAFHIPFILYDSSISDSTIETNLFSSIDIPTFILNKVDGNRHPYPVKRDYILSEYGGPGCPDIGSKPIWYTLITKEYRISLECQLDNNIAASDIISIYNRRKDPDEKYNQRKKLRRCEEILQLIEIVSNRHNELQMKYGDGKFNEKMVHIDSSYENS